MMSSTLRVWCRVTGALAIGLACVTLIGPPVLADSAEKLSPVAVTIDVLPGDASDQIVLRSRGFVPIAILSTAELNVADIDAASISVDGIQLDAARATIADVNGDGLDDLVVRVPRQLLALPEGAVSLTLRGSDLKGQPIVGTAAAVAVLPPVPDPAHEKDPVVAVAIDVLPGDGGNLLSSGNFDEVPVAVLSSETFDATRIEAESVELAGVPIAENTDGQLMVSNLDVNGDGLLDAIFGMEARSLFVPAGQSTIALRGATQTGYRFEGLDVVVGPGPGVIEPDTTLAPAQTGTFSNAAAIITPAAGTSGIANPYPSNIAVAGLPGTVQRVTVTMKGLNHTFPGDLDILLVGPGGQNIVIMSDVGSSFDVAGVSLTLSDLAALSLPTGAALTTGTFRPTNSGAGDAFPAPAPAASAATQLLVFNGTNPNGTWSLYVQDDAGGDVGSWTGGWSVTISTSITTQCFTSPITIPATGTGAATGAPANPYPAAISVAGLLGVVSSATVSLDGLSHTFPDDIDVLLAGPTGANAIVMSDVGGTTDAVGVTLTLDDAAASSLPDNGPLASGTFKPTNVGGGDLFPAPAPAPAGGSLLSIFNGTDPNGAWNLWVVDDAAIDIGSFAGGWCLTLTTTFCGGSGNCDDGNPCTDDVCNPATGLCSNTNDDTNACVADSNPCTDDRCQAGVCVAVNDDTNACTADTNPCTDDRCQAGACVGINDDTNTCTGADTNPCTDDACRSGACVGVNDDTNPCSDGNPCTRDRCLSGDCVDAGPVGTTTFANPAVITIPGAGTGAPTGAPANPYPSTILVPPFTGLLEKVEVNLSRVRHTFPDDIDVMLAGPGGQNLLVMADAGSLNDILNVDLTFSDTAATVITDAGTIVSGTFRPGNFAGADAFPAPAPAPSAATALSIFNGTNPTGTWNLWVVDDLGIDIGAMDGGWSLTLTVDCEDNDACTIEGCDASGCTHTPVVCDDGNPCTDDTCVPATGCVYTPNTEPCDDGNACTTNDTCGGGTCNGGPPPICDDGNTCTTDGCDSSSGCFNLPRPNAPCDDSNACTTGDTCDAAGTTCVGGAPPDCNDGNNCTNDSCAPATGCVNTDNGTCGDNPKGQGYYKRLCSGPHASGEFISSFDVDCVNDTATFADVTTVAELCDRMDPNPNNDKCEQAEEQFMALSLNLCRGRVQESDPINSSCGSNTTVGQSAADADALLSDPARNHATCTAAQCESEEINSGAALEVNSLTVSKEGASIRLNWRPPYNPDTLVAPVYRVWRKAANSSQWVQLQQTGNLTFLDTTAASGNYEYEITTVK